MSLEKRFSQNYIKVYRKSWQEKQKAKNMNFRVYLKGVKGKLSQYSWREKTQICVGDINTLSTISYFTSLQKSGQEAVYAIWTLPLSGSISLGKYCFLTPTITLMGLVFQYLKHYIPLSLVRCTSALCKLAQSNEISLNLLV